MSILLIVSTVFALLFVYFFSIYNRFVALKTRIEASTQEIGNQLKRQADLIPNLVNSVKGYIKHEKEIFKELTEARKEVVSAVKQGERQKMVDAASRVERALAPIKAVFESTPELKAVGPTQKLMDELRDTADKVMYARRTLIDLTADYNIMRAAFPSNLIASIFDFQKEPGLDIPKNAKEEISSVKKKDLKTPEVDLEKQRE